MACLRRQLTARTSVVIKSGAQTRLAGIFQAAVFYCYRCCFFIASHVSKIPHMPALAGVLVVTAWRMK